MTKQQETEEHRNFVTIALTKITSDMEKVKEVVEKNENWLAKLNGRVRNNEKDISRMKGIGGTVATIILAIIGWFRIGE